MQPTPTVGRIVHFISEDGTPNAALIVHVWSDTCVNLVVWNSAGTGTSRNSCTLGDTPGAWMWPART